MVQAQSRIHKMFSAEEIVSCKWVLNTVRELQKQPQPNLGLVSVLFL